MAANCPLVPSVWGVLRRARTRVLRVIRPPGCSLATHGRSQPSPSPRHAAAFARHFHAATLELSHRSAPPEHSRHRKADNTLAEASSLLSTRPVTALSPAQHHRLPNLATCTRLEALQDSVAAFGHQHNGHEHSMCCTGHRHAPQRTGMCLRHIWLHGHGSSSRSCPPSASAT